MIFRKMSGLGFGTMLFILSGVSSCSSTPSRPKGPVPWTGKFVGIDHRYDLYMEAPDPADPGLMDTYLTPAGKSKDDPDSIFRLFRMREEKAYSTHVRRILEDSCPQEMRRDSAGIRLIDRCGGDIDYSGFYEWKPGEGGTD